jgi:signal transduction histidine kinase
MVQTIIKEHGSDIKTVSKKKEGTTFIVELPLKKLS